MRFYFQYLIWFFVAFLAAAPAHAGFVGAIFGAIGAFAASSAIGGIVVNALVGIALSVGSSLLSNLFMKRQGTQQTPDPGTTVSLRVGGDNPLMFPCGNAPTGGVRVYYGVWDNGGTPNEYMVDVLALSAIPLKPGALPLEVWMNDEKVTVRFDLAKTDKGWPIENYRKKGQYWAWFDFFDGNQTTANPYLTSKFGGDPNYPWSSDMIGRGVAYCTITCRYDKDGLWSSGYPTTMVVLPSVPLYDPRKDSTAGGSGAHRWGQWETYEPSNNAMVRAYNVARGFYYNDEWVYGGQNWPALRLPASSWMTGMNTCDVEIGDEPQFHGGGTIECDVEIAKSLEELLRSASALIAEIGGAYKIRVGAPGAPVMSFNDGNILVTKEQGYDPFPGLESTYNIANITYTEPVEKWSTKESPSRRNEDFIASDDGRELPFSVDLPWVLSNLTAQRIGKTALENGRRFRRHTMYQAPLFWLIEPLDVVAWTSDYNQYEAKEFDVEQIAGNSALIQSMIIRENDPSDFTWNPLSDALPYEVVPLVPNVVPPQTVTGWQVFPAAIVDEQGRERRPSIEVRFDGALTDIQLVRVQVRTAGVTIFDGTVPYPVDPVTTASIILNGDFPPDTDCEVRGKFMPYTDRDTEWSAWLPVTTPDIKLQPGLDYDPFEGLVGFDSLEEDLAGYQDWIGGGLREIERRLEEYDIWMSDQDFGNETDRQAIRQQLTATYDAARAEWKLDVDVVASETAAVAQRVEQLDAELTGEIAGNATAIDGLSTRVTAAEGEITANANDITSLESTVSDQAGEIAGNATAIDGLETEVSSIDGRVTATAQAITSLSAATDPNNVNTANFRMQVVSGPSGYSRIGAEGRVGGSGGWRTAGWYLDVPNNTALPTRMAVQADQFVVLAGSGGQNQVFAVDGTAVRMNVANIGTVTAGLIRSANNKVRFDLNAGTLTMDD